MGRGPLAGPVTVCAFCIPVENKKLLHRKLKNSKALSAKKREEFYKEFRGLKKLNKCDYRVSSVNNRYIDKNGIVNAINLALRRVLDQIEVSPKNVLILLDGGLRAPETYEFQKTIIKGDEKEPVIAAASIMAKVTRDRFMVRIAKKYPEYGFDHHKGYGTKKHISRLKSKGLAEIHRKSFLKNLL